MRPHRRRSSFTNFFCPKNLFILPCLCLLRAFSEGLSVRELRTQSCTEEAQREIGWELAANLCFYVTNPVPNFFFGGAKGGIAPNFFSPFFPALFLGCRKWGCNKWGLKGCLAALPGNRPKSAFFALFLPFSPFSAFFALFRRVRRAIGKSRKRRKKAFFLRYPRISLNPHLLNPHLQHSNCPKKIHAKSMPLSGPKSTPI